MKFSELKIKQCFFDHAAGGMWKKTSQTQGVCMEDDSAFKAGETAEFKDHENVTACSAAGEIAIAA